MSGASVTTPEDYSIEKNFSSTSQSPNRGMGSMVSGGNSAHAQFTASPHSSPGNLLFIFIEDYIP